MLTLNQVTNAIDSQNLSASQFRDLLKSNEIPFYEGWKDQDTIFYLLENPKTVYFFSDIDGFLLCVVNYR